METCVAPGDLPSNAAKEEKESEMAEVRSSLYAWLVRDWTTESGSYQMIFSSSEFRVEATSGVIDYQWCGMSLPRTQFEALLKQTLPVPGRVIMADKASFVIRLEAETEEVDDNTVVDLNCIDLLHHMAHINAPVLKKVLASTGSDRVESRGGCASVKFREAKLPAGWSDFRHMIKAELERNDGECAKQLQRVIWKRRKQLRKDVQEITKTPEELEARRTILPAVSALVIAGNPNVSWKKKGSQQMAAPVEGNTFVTLYRMREGMLIRNLVRDARLLSKELKEHSVQFRERQCHRLMCVSKSFPLDLKRVIRHRMSQEPEDGNRSVLESRWASSMQGMLVESMKEFSDDIQAEGKWSITSHSDERSIFALFTWDYTFHMICEQAVQASNLELEELEYSFYKANLE